MKYTLEQRYIYSNTTIEIFLANYANIETNIVLNEFIEISENNTLKIQHNINLEDKQVQQFIKDNFNDYNETVNTIKNIRNSKFSNLPLN